LQIGLAWFLVPAYGLSGAAWAASAGFAGLLGVQLWLLRYRYTMPWSNLLPRGAYALAVVKKFVPK
jgi:O-antigen/teichoic acid export membrane protein